MDLVKIIAVGLVGIIIVTILVLGYFGFVPGISDLMGTNKPRNLGVTYGEVNYASGIAKVPGAVVNNPEFLCVGCSYTSSGSIPVNESFTQEEFSAMFNKRNKTKGPISDAQFKFNADGTMEASAMIDHPQIKGPIYIKGSIKDFSSKNVDFDLEYVEFGRVGIPTEQMPQAKQIVKDAIAQTFNNNPGLSINNIEIKEGQVVFDGTLPKEVTGNPNTTITGLQ